MPGKPPLLSGSDCVHLKLVKICVDEVHSVSLSTVDVKPHLMADNSRHRDMPRKPEPTSSPRVSNVTHFNTTGKARSPTQTMKWVFDKFQYVHNGLGQLGRPVTLDKDPTGRQPVARHTKIREQLNKV